jgi:hypothetical protein
MKGFLSQRMAGSHGIADVIGIKPVECGNPNHFEVKFIQVKVSKNLKKKSSNVKIVDSPIGLLNVEYWKFPVKVKNGNHNTKHTKKKMVKLQSGRRIRK